MILGCHVSYDGNGLLTSVEEAIKYGANTFMFYTGAPQNTIRKPISSEVVKQAHELMKAHEIDAKNVVCHAPYIVNLANQSDLEKWDFSIQFLKEELHRCELLQIPQMVLHPGSAVSGNREEGIQNIIRGLNEVVKDSSVRVLLETMAGKGNECGRTLEEIAEILNGVTEKEKFGVCIDTCHLHDAGYSMDQFDAFLDSFDKIIGCEKIGCVHLNDSKNERGSSKDRHENIGYGKIGFAALDLICHHEKLKEVPKILETPFVSEPNQKEKKYPPYYFEIAMLKKHTFDECLLEHIRSFYKNA